MRASNEDRERVARVLQTAMSEGRITVAELEERLDSVYAAKTVAELVPVTHDLPGAQVTFLKPTVPSMQPASPVPINGTVARGNLVAIMSGVERKGSWTAPAHLNLVAIMGGIELDFTGATLSAMDTVINVTAIMGGVEITVPEGMTVAVEGVGIMGAFEDAARQSYGPDAPRLRVKGAAIMGGVEIRARRKPITS